MIYHYPLQWPVGWPRSNSYGASAGFQVSYEQAEKELGEELERLGADSAYISTDQELRMDGQPRRDRQPSSTAVAVFFVRKGATLCIPCDKFNSVRDNLRAVGLTVEAIRRMERYGTSQMVEATLQGFKSLPSGGSTGSAEFHNVPSSTGSWWEVLQVSPTTEEEIVRAAWRRLTARYHPDGSEPDSGKYQQVQEAFKQYKESK
jgi:hypothetical protein